MRRAFSRLSAALFVQDFDMKCFFYTDISLQQNAVSLHVGQICVNSNFQRDENLVYEIYGSENELYLHAGALQSVSPNFMDFREFLLNK